MGDLDFWAILAYSAIWVSAIMLAINTERELRGKSPFLAKSHWGYVPLALLIVSAVVFAGQKFGIFGSGSYPTGCMTQWGPTGKPNEIAVEADGRCFAKVKATHYLSAVALHSFNVIDVMDEPITAKGGMHYIVDGEVDVMMSLGTKFLDEAKGGAEPTHYFLLLLPKTIAMDRFETVRQAQALGAVVVRHTGGPP